MGRKEVSRKSAVEIASLAGLFKPLFSLNKQYLVFRDSDENIYHLMDETRTTVGKTRPI